MNSRRTARGLALAPLLVLLAVYALPQAQTRGREASALELSSVPIESDALMAHVSVLEDETGALRQAELAERAHDFQLLAKTRWNVGYSNSVFWLRLPIHNPSGTLQPRYLGIYQAIDDAQLVFQHPDGRMTTKHLGRRLPFDARQVPTRTLYFSLSIPSGTSCVYLRLQTKDTLQLRLTLSTSAELLSKVSAQRWQDGLYYGALFALILYNLFLFVRLRERLYLSYVLFQGSFVLLQATLDQITFAWLWPHNPDWNAAAEVLFFGATMFGALAFSRAFLATAQHLQPFDRLLASLQWLGLAIAAAFPLVDWPPLVVFAMLYLVVGCSAMLVTGVAALRKVQASARIYLTAWVTLLCGACLASGTALGLLDTTDIALHSARVGSLVEGLLFALGLAYRIEVLQREKRSAHEALLRERAVYTAQLERDVAVRTHELSTTLRTLESTMETLTQQARLAALGHLVDGVVHEIGNPLNLLHGGAQSLPNLVRTARDTADQLCASPTQVALTSQLSRAGVAADLIASGASRIRMILDNLRDYASSRAVAPTAVDLAEALRTTLALTAERLRVQNISLTLQLSQLPRVNAQPGEICQVLTNLIVNAMQAMPTGGELRVRARSDQSWARLELADTGHGVPAHLRQAIFDPFFTTRDPAQGTGLGLSIAREIARRHGGDLLLLRAERGAAFELVLPTSREHVQINVALSSFELATPAIGVGVGNVATRAPKQAAAKRG